jgi:LPXTG-site transpeptidase (sortase) family protein
MEDKSNQLNNNMNSDKKKEIVYFAVILLAVFMISFVVFSGVGLAPTGLQIATYISDSDAPEGSIGYYLDSQIQPIKYIDEQGNTVNTVDSGNYTRPDRVVISKIGVNTPIEQPNTRNVATLDSLLSRGAVHYPGSGTVEQGNMFLFGHSTGFQVVQNQAYKTFNDLNKLENGDQISIFADGTEYIYKVSSLRLVNENNGEVRFDQGRRMLTISTCNSFGTKQERWVVEAEFYREV